MEDTGEYNDIELEETGKRYPQYDDMTTTTFYRTLTN
jgi:hypothetical protein